MKTIHIDVVSTEERIFSGNISFAVIPTITGELGIYPNHIPIMSIISPGVLRLTKEQEEIIVAVSGGILEVRKNSITILAEVAIRSAQMDKQRAQKAKVQAQEELKKYSKDDKNFDKAKSKLDSAIAQLKALEYIRSRK